MNDFTSVEMMTIAAARELNDKDTCFVGIGAPSAACNLARLTHAPNIKLIYESGTIGVTPDVLPLSIGDGILCKTAVTTVSVPELFRYWLQGGRIEVGFLGGAQIDVFGNINTTVIGDYYAPDVRLPGGGGAPEIALSCRKTYIVMKQSKRGFVRKLDFHTSTGHGDGNGYRERSGIKTEGPVMLITDLAIWKRDRNTDMFTVVSLHPNVSTEQIVNTVNWDVHFSDKLLVTPPPTNQELSLLRDLHARTAAAHDNGVEND